MRKQVLRSLRESFRYELESDGTFFKVSDGSEANGADVYVWHFSRDLNFFVYLLPNPKSYRDSFMVELAWSSSDFPKNAALQHNKEVKSFPDGRIRLPVLWREQWTSAIEPWWELGDSLSAETSEEFYSEEETRRRLAHVPESVTNALEKIKTYALPFFKRIASERGLSEC